MAKDLLIDYCGAEVLREDLPVLKDVNFRLQAGEYVYLIGRVGSGKSSLLKTMYAELPVTAQRADVLGYDMTSIRERNVPYLRRQLGIVFQDFQLLTDRSVRENLDFVLRATGWKKSDEMEARVEEVLTQVGMLKKAYRMPHELSGGEQQRIAIARALLNKPQIILADEPTGNLDPQTGRQIVDLLYRISKEGTAVIMSTHNLSFCEDYPGRIYRCENHRLEEL
ncbi:MAG: ATP-binding cassette domain-containing protein [Bacteroidaceae bacterium]|nr:ATP-binding cassette domain-containing protein [Bacteroidaceae bacterium]MBQ5776735.1 ATP-binding cassette domain-containing protein [Bacteroidaceae bacterium]MBR5001985.1 ATP-binding cassette domain-containing protein [Bacteroidaceae bacterium]